MKLTIEIELLSGGFEAMDVAYGTIADLTKRFKQEKSTSWVTEKKDPGTYAVIRGFKIEG